MMKIGKNLCWTILWSLITKTEWTTTSPYIKMWILPKQLHTSAFVQDTEALISDLQEQSQISAQSLLVRSKPSPVRTWLAKWPEAINQTGYQVSNGKKILRLGSQVIQNSAFPVTIELTNYDCSETELFQPQQS